jgi:LmbE family N-acetylglucosaminyl deacetylase
MAQTGFVRILGLVLCAGMLAGLICSSLPAQNTPQDKPDGFLANDRPPDARFRADILVVVAHPDDETLVTAYLAREIYDQHKRVAVVFGTYGEGSNNQVGPEQYKAMGDIREIEGRESVGSLGITHVWFLTGYDTLSQNVLNSLDHWGHGECLDELVRIVRLTRPSVILTFLPDFTTGENHADHQAAGVLATEAFDVAGDPTFFAEQVSPAENPDQNMNMTEGLRPWQPEKIYYFYNPTHDIFKGQGPQYSSNDISPSRHVSYAMLAAEAFEHHRTQGGAMVEKDIENQTLDKADDEGATLVTEPVKLIFGKSLVRSGTTDDVFTGVVPDGVPFERAPGYTPTHVDHAVLSIGDPWNFYHLFWAAHGLDHLENVVPLEVSVKVGGSIVIPLIVDNPLDHPIDVNLSVQAPDGWKILPTPDVSVAPQTRYLLRVRAAAPDTKLPGWQQFVVTGRAGGKAIGTVAIRAELSTGWVAPQ